MNFEQRVKDVLKESKTPEEAYEKLKQFTIFEYKVIKEAYERSDLKKLSEMYLYIVMNNKV